MAIYVDNAVAQFENVNELRSFPFSDGSSLVSVDGRELPRNFITDVRMFVPADVSGGSFPVVSLSSVHISSGMVSACVKSEFAGSVQSVSVIVSKDTFRPYFPYRMEKLVGSSDIGGFITFGEIEFPPWPETFRFDGAVVHRCCVVPMKPAGLRRIVDRRSGDSISGNVDVAFTGYVESKRDGKSVTLRLEDGAAKELASPCLGETDCGATPIRSINGVKPDEHGNIVIWFH